MQIAEEAKGKVIEEYFYSFEQDGKKVVGISYSGVRHVATEMMKQGFPITIESCEVMDNGETYRAKAVAKNITTNVCFPGFAEQPKKFKSGHVNTFAYTIAASKAERNALRKHIPETAIKAAYRSWQGSKKPTPETARNVTPLENARAQTKKGPDVLGSAESQKLLAEMKGKIVWLHKLDDGGERKMNETDLVGYAKIFKNGSEICPLLHETIQSHNGAFLLDGFLYTEEEEAGLYHKVKEAV
jgi:hypothetical protein